MSIEYFSSIESEHKRMIEMSTVLNNYRQASKVLNVVRDAAEVYKDVKSSIPNTERKPDAAEKVQVFVKGD